VTAGPLTTSTTSDTTGPDDTTTEPVDTTTTTTTTETTADPCTPDCLPCEVCVAGTCVTNTGAACDFPTNPACETRVWGLDMATGDCHAYASTAPVCVGPGLCEHPPCTAPGAVLVDCGAECLLGSHNCMQGMPVVTISAASVCAPPGSMTQACASSCDEEMNGKFTHHVRFCDDSFTCQLMSDTSCNYAKCSPDSGCKLGCIDNMDCIAGAECIADVCVQ
jgi:hypothetical protein